VKTQNQPVWRTGFTTGSCAAAAAKAAAETLIRQQPVEHTRITLPDGTPAIFKIVNNRCDPHSAQCSVIKDAGDDPDITNGCEICAAVSWDIQPGIKIYGGEGVGIITRPGLPVAVGEPAINPVPLKMIASATREVMEEYHATRGVKVVISVPNGVQLARRTLNPRLGIVGGISILGTSGIVIPYSTAAYVNSLKQCIDVASAMGHDCVVLTTGRRSERYAQKNIHLAEECFIQAGDYIGEALQACRRKMIKQVIVWGMIGKITKLAAGHLYTNISDSEIDIGFLTAIAAACGAGPDDLARLSTTISANHFRETLPAACRSKFISELCEKASLMCCRSVDNTIRVECIMSDFEGNILGRSGVKA
jgi:cobalt-precorrin-5B (C1)-methyltransferase